MGNKPTLRKEILTQFYDAWRNVTWKTIEHNGEFYYPFRNCINCEHFNEDQEYCRYWKAKPPARVICYGCDRHVDIGDIPF